MVTAPSFMVSSFPRARAAPRMCSSMAADSNDPAEERQVLYQICRAGDRFEVGDGPFDLGRIKVLILGRGNEGGYDAKPAEDIIRVADPWMSGRHASITVDGAGHKVK